MRKIITSAVCICALSFLFISAFSQNEKQKHHYNDKPGIEGSGNIVTKDVAIQSFSQLEASGVFNLSLIQGTKESVKIEADDNLQQLFEVKNEGDKLIVDMKKDTNFNSTKRIMVYITFKNLKSMNLKMVGNVSSEGNLSFGDLSLDNKSVGSVELVLNAQKLDIKNKSVGNLKLSGKANDAVVRNNSVGAFRAGDLVVQTMDIDNDGIGGAEVNAAKELKVKDSFLGKVKNVGTGTKRINKVVI
ncbi:MAG TPA: head GIN domain-containing protein [Chitinophagaceae bacterium]|nr:head GIN domain-containing protein [Chitinophagaceae bacterium]